MTEPKDVDGCFDASNCSPDLPIYSNETIGRLLRRLNLMCVKAAQADDVKTARTAAAFSKSVEDAMRFAEIK